MKPENELELKPIDSDDYLSKPIDLNDQSIKFTIENEEISQHIEGENSSDQLKNSNDKEIKLSNLTNTLNEIGGLPPKKMRLDFTKKSSSSFASNSNKSKSMINSRTGVRVYPMNYKKKIVEYYAHNSMRFWDYYWDDLYVCTILFIFWLNFPL